MARKQWAVDTAGEVEAVQVEPDPAEAEREVPKVGTSWLYQPQGDEPVWKGEHPDLSGASRHELEARLAEAQFRLRCADEWTVWEAEAWWADEVARLESLLDPDRAQRISEETRRAMGPAPKWAPGYPGFE